MNGELHAPMTADPSTSVGTADVLPGDPLAEVVDLIAHAVQGCPAVAGLHGGRFGRATTYLPGRRVRGVAMSPVEIVIGVIGRYPASVAEIAAEVRASVALLVPGVSVTVTVEDLVLPGEVVAGGVGSDVESPGSSATARRAAVPTARVGPSPPAPTPGPRPGFDAVSARPPLATPLAPPEKEMHS